jgi:hypothetical protein
VLAAVFACKVNTNPDQPVAIELVLPDSARVEVTDTFRPSGFVLNGIGETLPDSLFWTSFDTTLKVVDSTTGVSFGLAVGTARLQARTGNLYSNPQNVAVIPRLDSITYADSTRQTLDVTPTDTTTDSLSDALKIKTFAFGGSASSRRVIFSSATYPDSAATATLLPKDSVATFSDGTASVQVRLHPGLLPDSVVVIARMVKLHGDSLPGSPVTFVVEIKP